MLVETAGSSAVRVVVAGHDYDRLLSAREVPKAWQRPLHEVHLQDEISQQVHLLVGLRDRYLVVEIHPIGLWITGRGAIELVVGANRRQRHRVLVQPRPDFPAGYKR